MADLNSQELQEQIDELTRSLNGLNGTVRSGGDAFNKELRARGLSAQKAQAAGEALDKLGSTATRLTGQLYKGEQGAKVFGDAVGDATDAVAQMAFAMGGPLVKALAVLGAGLVKYGRAAAEMSDTLFKSYQGISRAGAAGAEGLAGVFQQLQDFRLSLDDIGQLTELFGQNAQALAMFRGTVFEGAKSLGQLRRGITTSGLEREFMGLGMNTQEINESLVGFVALQSRLGIQQVRDNNKITASLNQYIQETDAITKLTGATRKQQEDAANEAMMIEQFRAKVSQLAAEGQTEEANRLMSIFKGFRAVSPATAAAFASAVTGFVTEGAGVTGQLVFQGELLEIANNRQIGLNEAYQRAGRTLDGFMSNVGDAQAATGNFANAFGGTYSEFKDLQLITKDVGTKFATIEEAQAAQRAAAEKGLGAQVDMRTAQMNSMQAMQVFVNIGVNPATEALAKLARVVETLTGFLPKTGGEAVGAAAGGVGGALAGAKAGAAIGTLGGGPIGTVVGGIGGAIAGYFGGKASGGMFGGGSGPDPNEVFQFTGNTGDLAHFNKLDPKVKEAALQMGAEYLRMTGKKLQINSAFRSLEEQASVQATGGAPKASPGNSLHEVGRALDMQSDQTAFLEQNGLLAKYGFKSGRSFNDPQHIYMRDGGIATGPKSGYAATLHGTEAVVPLPNGNAIPVDMSAGMSDGLGRQTDIMTQQLAKLEDLVSVMRNQVSLSQQILQHSTN